MSMRKPADERARRIARRLRALFADVHPAGRGPWTPQEVAESCRLPLAEVERLLTGAELADEAAVGAVARHFRAAEEWLTAPEDAPLIGTAQRLARRLNLLFSDIYPAGRGPWTHQEVAEAAGVPVEEIRRMCAAVPPAGDAFAARLDQLCLRISPATGRPYSNREVGAAVGKSGQYIGNLRAGLNEPGLPVATALAHFFDVGLPYFVHGPVRPVAQHFLVAEVYLTAEDDSPAVREIEDSLRMLIALRDERVQRVVGRVLNKRWPG